MGGQSSAFTLFYFICYRGGWWRGGSPCSRPLFRKQFLSRASWRKGGQSRWSAAGHEGTCASNTLTACPGAIPLRLRNCLRTWVRALFFIFSLWVLGLVESPLDFPLWSAARWPVWRANGENVFPAVHEARGFSDKLLSGVFTKITFPMLEGRETSAPNLHVGPCGPSAARGRTPFPKNLLCLTGLM